MKDKKYKLTKRNDIYTTILWVDSRVRVLLSPSPVNHLEQQSRAIRLIKLKYSTMHRIY